MNSKLKKILCVVGVASMAMFTLAGCGGAAEEEAPAEEAATSEITVYAAASMTESLDKVIAAYEGENEGVKVNVSYGSSGDLETQIKEGEAVDVFISAGQKQMNELEAGNEANLDESDYVVKDSRVDLLENKVVLCVAETSKADIKSFDDLAAHLKAGDITFAMGNVESVPVGQYTDEILKNYGLDHAALADKGVISYCEDVKAVTTAVTEGNVDCGIIYATDAYSAGLTPVAEAGTDICSQIIYPAAVMSCGANQEEGQKFLDYLQTEGAMKEFQTVGFTPVK